MAQTDTRYNGWASWATWNVALWFGNDEGLYREACRRAREARFNADTAEEFVRETLPNGTPDMKPRHYLDVDWQAIADRFNAMVSE